MNGREKCIFDHVFRAVIWITKRFHCRETIFGNYAQISFTRQVFATSSNKYTFLYVPWEQYMLMSFMVNLSSSTNNFYYDSHSNIGLLST